MVTDYWMGTVIGYGSEGSGKVSRAPERPFEQPLEDPPGQTRLNVDETGHEQNGDRQCEQGSHLR